MNYKAWANQIQSRIHRARTLPARFGADTTAPVTGGTVAGNPQGGLAALTTFATQAIGQNGALLAGAAGQAAQNAMIGVLNGVVPSDPTTITSSSPQSLLPAVAQAAQLFGIAFANGLAKIINGDAPPPGQGTPFITQAARQITHGLENAPDSVKLAVLGLLTQVSDSTQSANTPSVSGEFTEQTQAERQMFIDAAKLSGSSVETVKAIAEADFGATIGEVGGSEDSGETSENTVVNNGDGTATFTNANSGVSIPKYGDAPNASIAYNKATGETSYNNTVLIGQTGESSSAMPSPAPAQRPAPTPAPSPAPAIPPMPTPTPATPAAVIQQKEDGVKKGVNEMQAGVGALPVIALLGILGISMFAAKKKAP